MIEREQLPPLTNISNWFVELDLGSNRQIDTASLKKTLLRFGAREVKNPEDLEKLGKYNLNEAGEGMRLVWGDSRLDQFDVFLAKYIAVYNETPGNRRLPRTKSSFSGEMGLGMRRFFLELTQRALDILDSKTFAERTRAAIENGELWQEKKDDQRIKLVNPASNGEPKRVLEIAPNYLPKFLKWLKKTSPKNA